MKVLKYDLIGAHKAGVTDHPQRHLESLGIKVLDYEGVPIGDCVMVEAENIPEVLPDYITYSNYELVK